MIDEPCIPDEKWVEILSFAAPHVSPGSPEGLAARRRAEAAIRLLVLGTFCVSPDGRSWQDYAEAGLIFLQGIKLYEAWFEQFELLFEPYKHNPAYRPKLPPELQQQIEHACSQFVHLQVSLEDYQEISRQDASEPKVKSGPNAKPELHAAVADMYDLWLDLRGRFPENKKKDFLAFSYAVLRHARTGVTRNSVLESFDRHVRHWERFKG